MRGDACAAPDDDAEWAPIEDPSGNQKVISPGDIATAEDAGQETRDSPRDSWRPLASSKSFSLLVVREARQFDIRVTQTLK